MSIFDPLLDAAASPRLVWVTLQIGLGCLTLGLLLLLLTRWGHYRPLRKCAILSLWAHLLLMIYLATIDILPGGRPHGTNQVRVTAITESPIAEQRPEEESTTRPAEKPWERVAVGAGPLADKPSLARPDVPSPEPQINPGPAPPLPKPEPPAELASTAPVAAPPSQPLPDPSLLPTETTAAESLNAPMPERADAPTSGPALPEAPRTAERPSELPAIPLPDTKLPTELLTPPSPLARMPEAPIIRPPEPSQDNSLAARDHSQPAPSEVVEGAMPPPVTEVASATLSAPAIGETGSEPTAGAQGNPNGYQPPAVYQLRFAPDRAAEVARRGGSAQTEAAVAAALEWLARNQNADGRWEPARFGAGREDQVLGHDRQGAGRKADTGITGLALLAFMGAGHTQHAGLYSNNVARGLAFLVRSQTPDGFLGAEAETCAQMYCHGMAALALSEAYALTGDPGLREPVRRAAQYTIAAQNPVTGGWRYRPRDIGDTSQLGWQLMALRSAELAGLEIPSSARQGMHRFLASVSNGSRGGLACYRPGERNSRTMTAEALVCKQMLGLPREHATAQEAASYLVADELPGQGTPNLYYWYYATLGLYQQQGEAWEKWNATLSPRLVAMQRTDKAAAGSWDPNDVWGGYGGRVYSTALGALCLEVYYRYLPLYAPGDDPAATAGKDRSVK